MPEIGRIVVGFDAQLIENRIIVSLCAQKREPLACLVDRGIIEGSDVHIPVSPHLDPARPRRKRGEPLLTSGTVVTPESLFSRKSSNPSMKEFGRWDYNVTSKKACQALAQSMVFRYASGVVNFAKMKVGATADGRHSIDRTSASPRWSP